MICKSTCTFYLFPFHIWLHIHLIFSIISHQLTWNASNMCTITMEICIVVGWRVVSSVCWCQYDNEQDILPIRIFLLCPQRGRCIFKFTSAYTGITISYERENNITTTKQNKSNWIESKASKIQVEIFASLQQLSKRMPFSSTLSLACFISARMLVFHFLCVCVIG